MTSSGKRNGKDPSHLIATGDEQSSLSEVDQLLLAAQDQLLLNLRVNSHTKSQTPSFPSSSSHLDTDLARRFDALKSKQSKQTSITNDKKESSGIIGDDLAARFAALKASPGPPTNLALEQDSDRVGFVSDGDSEDDEKDEDGVSKKEVEKLMEWAKDAARLDPLPKSDDDVDDVDVDVDVDVKDSDDEDEDSEEEERRKKGKEKGKGKGKGKGKPKRILLELDLRRDDLCVLNAHALCLKLVF